MADNVIIWNSALIQQTLEKLRMGIPVNMSAFHFQDIELKAGEILYQLTPDEVDEFHKCSNDIMYFVEKYCRFLTDTGRKIVKLREYQKKILIALAKEEYSDKFSMLIPAIRNLIVMASRQSGKCFFNGDIIIQDKTSQQEIKIPINLLYYIKKQHLTFLEKIKVKLMLIYYKL